MSKGLTVAILAVLLGILGVMSYSLHKQTDPAPPPSQEEIAKREQQMAETNKARKKLEINAKDTAMKGGKVPDLPNAPTLSKAPDVPTAAAVHGGVLRIDLQLFARLVG